MTLIWKSNFWRILSLNGMLILLCAIFPTLTGLGPLAALRSLFCGYPLNRVELKGGFLLTASILQCCNWLSLSYIVKNESWLLLRYGNRRRFLCTARRMVLLVDCIIVLVLGAVTWIEICLQNRAAMFPPMELLEISGRGLLECVLLSSVQLTLLLFMGEEKTAMVMLTCAVVMALLSNHPLFIAWIAPVRTDVGGTVLSSTTCIVAVMTALRIQTHLYCKRGAARNGNMY